jgi:hypothetical protein
MLEILSEFVILLFNSMLYCCTSVPSVRTGTEPKEPKPNGSLFGFDFLGTIFLENRRTEPIGSVRTERPGLSSRTPPCAGSSSTTSPTSRVWVPRHVARPIACRRLLRLRHATGCLGSSRGSSHRSSSTTSPLAGSSSTTLPTPRVRVPRHVARLVSPLDVDYFAYATHLGASARRATRHTALRRLLRAPRLRLAATLALLQPRRAS